MLEWTKGKALLVRYFVLLLAPVMTLTAVIALSVAAVTGDAGPPHAAKVVWFSGDRSQGLRQDSSRALVASGRKLAVAKPIARLYAAAYYPDARVLLTVDRKAVTRLYEGDGRLLKLRQIRPPRDIDGPRSKHRPIRPVLARFCNIPGLVYLTWSYPPHSNSMIQVPTQFTERLALGSRARNWHAVASEKPYVTLLDQTYRVASDGSVHLTLSDGKRIVLRVPGQLAQPVPDMPYVERESVFVLPGRAIFCQMRNGWSMHNFNGKLIGRFASEHRYRRSWWPPFYHKGHFYVSEVTKGFLYYRFDVSRGKLEYVGTSLP